MPATMTVKVLDQKGQEVKSIRLNKAVFGIEPNQQAMFDAVVMQQASLRQGTADTKTRAEVSGGGRKPRQQKGSGRSRQGSIRAPQWRGGGVVFGPTPRSYRFRINRKVYRLAMRSYLSQIVADKALVVVDKIALDAPKTKDMVEIMKALNVDRKVLFVFDEQEDWENAWLSMRNLPNAAFATARSLSCLEMADAYSVVATEAAVKKIEEGLK